MRRSDTLRCTLRKWTAPCPAQMAPERFGAAQVDGKATATLQQCYVEVGSRRTLVMPH
jgi:hypothetical protein